MSKASSCRQAYKVKRHRYGRACRPGIVFTVQGRPAAPFIDDRPNIISWRWRAPVSRGSRAQSSVTDIFAGTASTAARVRQIAVSELRRRDADTA